MTSTYILPLLKSTAILISVSLFFSCNHAKNSDTAEILRNVESYMNDRPDSALSVLQSISKQALSSKELKARHALLLSQALDKNLIDLQSDSIIAPAVRYYENTHDHESLFKAYYYYGRIMCNARKYAEAMQAYSKAEEMINRVSDDLSIGLLYSQIGYLYQLYYNNNAAINSYIKASEYYAKAGSESHCHLAELDLGSLYHQTRDHEKAELLICNCLEWAYSIGRKDIFDACIDILFLAGMTEDKSETINQCINRFGLEALDNSTMVNIGLAYKYAEEKDDRQFKAYIDKAWKCADNFNDTSSILFTEYKIYEKKGDLDKALIKLTEIASREDSLIRVLIKEPLLEAKVSYLNAQNSEIRATIENQKLKIKLMVLVCLTAILAIGLIIILVRKRLRQKSMQLERYADLYESTVSERDALSEMLGLIETQAVPEETRRVVARRLDVLNSVITSYISNRNTDIKKADSALEELIADRDSFIESTRTCLEMSHPAFFRHLYDKELTDWEINYCCLYLIGLKGKDIGEYINLKRHYTYGSVIRLKLGLTENDTNLSLYLKKLLDGLQP